MALSRIPRTAKASPQTSQPSPAPSSCGAWSDESDGTDAIRRETNQNRKRLYDRPVPVVEKSTRPKWMPNDMYKLNPTKEDFNNYHKNKYRQTLLNIKKNGGLHEGNFWKVLKKIKNRGLKQEERVQIALEVINS